MFKIAILGRPNVGKSTLFNKIAGMKTAIVNSSTGVTRDRHFATCNYFGKTFQLIDSGGMEFDDTHLIKKETQHQTELAIASANFLIFVVDSKAGITSLDEQVAKIVYTSGTPALLAVNKVDNDKQLAPTTLFAKLGFKHMIPVSAEHSRGIEELLDKATAALTVDVQPETISAQVEKEPIRIAIIGAPNTGKSSLVNKILNDQRMMVTTIAGTTRDAIDSECRFHSRKFILIDTAGIRRKATVKEQLEKLSVIMTIKAVERADIVLLLIDATKKATTQDSKIGSLIDRAKCGVIIAYNKWDLIEKDEKSLKNYQKDIKNRFKFLPFAPTLFISAMTGEKIHKIFEQAEDIYSQYSSRMTTGKLNSFFDKLVKNREIPSVGKHQAKLYYATQIKSRPPTFVIVVNNPDYIHFSYKRYLINRLREAGNFSKSPINLILKKRSRKEYRT
ncbi:MAG: ribosome biogenesis GTPase Der [Nitrospinota bacterium]